MHLGINSLNLSQTKYNVFNTKSSSVNFSGSKDALTRKAGEVTKPLREIAEQGASILSGEQPYFSPQLGVTVTEPVDKMIAQAVDAMPWVF